MIHALIFLRNYYLLCVFDLFICNLITYLYAVNKNTKYNNLWHLTSNTLSTSIPFQADFWPKKS